MFRIPSVILLKGCFYKINIDNQSMCRRMRIYSTHFFCLHYSLIIVMKHFPKMYLDDKLIQMLEVLILCLLISNIIIYFKQFKYFFLTEILNVKNGKFTITIKSNHLECRRTIFFARHSVCIRNHHCSSCRTIMLRIGCHVDYLYLHRPVFN